MCCTDVEKVCAAKGPPVALTANVQPTHVHTYLCMYKIISIHTCTVCMHTYRVKCGLNLKPTTAAGTIANIQTHLPKQVIP